MDEINSTIYWRVYNGRDEKTGAVFPHLGEDWGAMREFLKSTNPTGYLIAYYYDNQGCQNILEERNFAEDPR